MTRSVSNLLLLFVLTTVSTLAALPVQAQIEVTKSNGTITIDGTNLDDVVTVSIPNANVVRVQANGQITDFPCQTNGGSAPTIMFMGFAGADEFVNQTQLSAVAYGGSGPDRLIATTGPVKFYGEGGADFIAGSPVADTLAGGTGDDEIFGFEGNDDIVAGAGADYVAGGIGNDTISGGLGADTLFGQEGEDVIRGDDGEDYISGGLGADFINGGSQDDQLLGGDGNDNIIGGPGGDLMLGGLGSDSLCGGLGDDELRGGDGNDSLFGEAGIDVLLGGAGVDDLDQDNPGPCALNGYAWPNAFQITHVPLYTIVDDESYDFFGHSVSGAGDVNGDGLADIIIGVPHEDNNAQSSGSAQVISGLDRSILYTFNGDNYLDIFGWSVSSAGDVNGDGRADIIVGAPDDDNNGVFSGIARVHSGLDGSILFTVNGDSARDYFGYSVSSAGDVNGDGRADLIVGAPGHDNVQGSGSARVLSGLDGSLLYTFDGDNPSAKFGWSVSDAGDVNGDGRGDLIVGSPWDNTNGVLSGSARVFSGIDGSVLYTFHGHAPYDLFGHSVSGAGDVNGDGRADLIVGSPTSENNGAGNGSARVLSGLDGSILYTFEGDRLARFGWSVSGPGDVNGDGRADLIVGAPEDDSNGHRSGSAQVFSGLDGSILYNLQGDFGNQFGHSVSGVGDLNGDRLADFIIGSPSQYGTGNARVFVSQGVPVFLLGDVNRDDVVNFLDIAPFITLLSSNTFQVEADINGDQGVNFLDIAPFIALLSTQ